MSSDNATNTARGARPNGRACRNVDFEGRVIFRDASPYLLDEFEFGNAESACVVKIEFRVRESVPAGTGAGEVEINNVVGISRHALERENVGLIDFDLRKRRVVLL